MNSKTHNTVAQRHSCSYYTTTLHYISPKCSVLPLWLQVGSPGANLLIDLLPLHLSTAFLHWENYSHSQCYAIKTGCSQPHCFSTRRLQVSLEGIKSDCPFDVGVSAENDSNQGAREQEHVQNNRTEAVALNREKALKTWCDTRNAVSWSHQKRVCFSRPIKMCMALDPVKQHPGYYTKHIKSQEAKASCNIIYMSSYKG